MEMLVVLAIMSLAAFMFAGRMTAPERYGSRKDVAKITGLLEDARRQALLTGRPVAVSLDALPEGYSATAVVGDATASIIFYPDGSSSGGAVSKGAREIVRVSWLTGLARAGE